MEDHTTEDDQQEDDDQSDLFDRHFMSVIEALIFASDEPLTFRQIKAILEDGKGNDQQTRVEGPSAPLPRGNKRGVPLTINRFRLLVAELNQEYERHNRAFRIVEIAGGYSFQTVPEYGTWVGRLFAARSRRRLTPSALETLAIIAFRQPISKPAIEAIRGVNADHVIKSLLEKDLITIVGREDTVGRPLLYGTTKTFLVHFGLGSLGDLPKPREIEELFREEDAPDADPTSEEAILPAEEHVSDDTVNPGDDDSKHPFFQSPTVNVGITLDEDRDVPEDIRDAEPMETDENIIRNSRTATDEETNEEEENDY
ncbi:MAG: SMC-Scp complex subunit ScpB [Chlorobi bacterium]|nr:SMC-Scp complex subunit ScpB [Chlorobiota bacterium]